MAETIETTESNEPAFNLSQIVTKTVADIAFEKLKENSKGFYSVELSPVADRFLVQAKAGVRVSELLKISGTLVYDPSGRTLSGGLSIGGEFSL